MPRQEEFIKDTKPKGQKMCIAKKTFAWISKMFCSTRSFSLNSIFQEPFTAPSKTSAKQKQNRKKNCFSFEWMISVLRHMEYSSELHNI